MSAKTKPKFVSTSSFEALVQEAAEAALAVRALDTFEAFKLTAKAFLREACAIGRTDSKRLADLQRELDSDAVGLDHARQALRRMVALIRGRNSTAPPRELRRLSFLMSDAAMAEMAAIKSSAFEFFALAAKIAGDAHPEDFGSAESSEGIKTKLLDASLKRDELFERIGTQYSAQDIEARDVNLETGSAKMFFRGTDVATYPQHDCGQRLVTWWISNKGKQ